jgi:hypothetical protein
MFLILGVRTSGSHRGSRRKRDPNHDRRLVLVGKGSDHRNTLGNQLDLSPALILALHQTTDKSGGIGFLEEPSVRGPLTGQMIPQNVTGLTIP